MFRGVLYCFCFLLCVLVLAKVRSRRVRQSVLLIASYTLYVSWGAWFAVVLLASTIMNFWLGKCLRKNPSQLILSIGILLNLAILSSFKYLPELAVSLPLSSLQRLSHLALPLGISFWTFQAMSYLFDLYREEDLDPTFFEFALYMSFFPVAISGPVCRMPEMLPQFRSEESITWNDFGRGFSRVATGVFMMQLARLLGQGILSGDGINAGFDHATRWSGTDVWCLALGYGLQLFFDFAGYSHIAIGAAAMMGFALPENFDRPFQSQSPSIFWARWHMSLSFWIRDYLFLPLAVIRRDVWWRNFVLLSSMIVFGVWHKASLLFVLWGCYHGGLLVLHRQWQQLQRRLDWEKSAPIWTPVNWAVTIGLISLGWIFFRAGTLTEAAQMLSAVVSPTSYLSHFVSGSLYCMVTMLIAGYAGVLWITNLLDDYLARMNDSGVQASSGFVGSIVRNRWFWIPPLYVIALLIVLIVTLTHGSSTSGLMYRTF